MDGQTLAVKFQPQSNCNGGYMYTMNSKIVEEAYSTLLYTRIIKQLRVHYLKVTRKSNKTNNDYNARYHA